MKVETRPERCKECGLCVVDCPKKAISFAEETNSAGYHYTVIDDENVWHAGPVIPYVQMVFTTY